MHGKLTQNGIEMAMALCHMYFLKESQDMAEYRKRKGLQYDTWHWCRNCANDPKSDYVTRSTRPDGDLCNQCKSKEANGDCTS